MRHITLKLIPCVFTFAVLLSACGGGDDVNTWEEYKEWRELNTAYFEELKYKLDANGEMEYETLVPGWNSGSSILIKYLNDRSKTVGNLTPMETSTVSVKYKGWLCNDVAFDSSYNSTDSVFNTVVSNVISGWSIALQYMRVGDSVRVVIPYNLGYKASGSSSILPYSTLNFDIKLKDIVTYDEKL